jgi:hypothetical protein
MTLTPMASRAGEVGGHLAQHGDLHHPHLRLATGRKFISTILHPCIVSNFLYKITTEVYRAVHICTARLTKSGVLGRFG